MKCNLDGVPVFKSSSQSIWPVFISISGTPFGTSSHQNLFLHSILFGKLKPRFDVYLEPFVDDMNALNKRGILWLENGFQNKTKFVLKECMCDSVAWPALRNFKQFNGVFGCGASLHPGAVFTMQLTTILFLRFLYDLT